MIHTLFFVELTVSDWKRAVEWYSTVLGLQVILMREADRFALLQAGTGKLALKVGSPNPGTVLLTFEVDDLLDYVQRLRSLDVPVEEEIKTSAEGYRRVLLRDPDGYRLCLFEWYS
jgi:predicted enzyme related to lactoylglutathione lyase